MLEAVPSGYTVRHRATAYDLECVVRDLSAQGHPAADWLTDKMAAASQD